MLVIENCNSLSDLRQKLIDGEEVRTVRQEPCKVSEYDKDHIWYKGNQYISLRRFLEVKAEAEKEPCEDAIRREDAINAVSEALEHVFVEHEDIAKKMINKLPSVKPQESCKDAINRAKALEAIRKLPHAGWLVSTESVLNALSELPPVTPQPKTGHWVYKIYGGFHEQGDWYCSHCDYQYNYGNGHAKHCPECGYEMSEPPTEEVIRDKDYEWIIKR